MHLTILGSGTLIPDDDRRSAAHLLESGPSRLLLDCGAGTLHGFPRHRVPWRELTHLAITHFHNDHTGDVPALLFALKHGVRPPRERALTLLGPPGLREVLRAMSRAFGDHVGDPGFPVEVVELARQDVWEDPGALRIACHPTNHTDASVCYRVDGPEGAIGYTGDTGPDAEAAAFLAGCDVLVAECSLPDPPPMDTHLTPGTVADFAALARPGLLVLTHLYPPLDPSEVPDLVRRAGYGGDVVVGRDGTRVQVVRGRPPALDLSASGTPGHGSDG